MAKSSQEAKSPVVQNAREVKQVASSFGFIATRVEGLSEQEDCYLVTALNKEEKTVGLFLKRCSASSLASSSCVSSDLQRWLTHQMAQCGFQFAPEFYTCNEDGSSLVIEGENCWTCQSFIHNDIRYDWLKFDCIPQHCFKAGQALAGLHYAGSKLLRKSNPRVFRSVAQIMHEFPIQFESTIDKLKEQEKSVLNSMESDSENESVLLIFKSLNFDSLAAQSKKLTSDLSLLEKKAKQTINHGDYHPGNVLFSESGVQGVIDWDYACIGSGLYDLCYALFAFCTQTALEGERVREVFDERKTENFLNGYSSAGSVVKSMQHLRLYTQFIHVLMLDWVCGEICNPESKYKNHKGFRDLARTLSYCCG